MARKQDDEDHGLTFAVKALLVRHEAYVAEAEQSRREMTQRIDYLERDKSHLESENGRLAHDNAELEQHLEQLNSTIGEADTRIEGLEAALHSTHMEMRRQEALAARAADLEVQIMDLESEQEYLRNTLVHSEAEERSAVRRWRQAERKLVELQDQLEKIERESHDEKIRHEEVLRRIERQKKVDSELQNGKATISGKGGPNVVSHFVKDILQDNVNLQMGIVELREMLICSNDEVQKLRGQLMGHHPAEDDEHDEKTMDTEVSSESVTQDSAPVRQAVHVHHHYHHLTKEKEAARKPVPRKRRNVALPSGGVMHSRTSSRNRHRPQQPSIAATILSQTSMTIPSPRQRWSAQSYGAPSDFASSAPSSPQDYRSSVLFDHLSIDQGMEYSRPTSPDSSVGAMSPVFNATHKRSASERSNSNGSKAAQGYKNDTIHEEDGDVPSLASFGASSDQLVTQDDGKIGIDSDQVEDFNPYSAQRELSPKANRLRRSNSHESILGIAVRDIHTLQTRPSQLNITKSGMGLMFRTPSRQSLGRSTAALSTETVFGTGEVAAGKHDSSSLLRSTAGLPAKSTAPSVALISSNGIGTSNGVTQDKRSGGWVWGRWGVSPSKSPLPFATSSMASSVNNFRRSHLHDPQSRAVTMSLRKLQEENDPLKMMFGRSPGINQRGPVPGWRKPPKTPSQVRPERVDFEALREVLEDDL